MTLVSCSSVTGRHHYVTAPKVQGQLTDMEWFWETSPTGYRLTYQKLGSKDVQRVWIVVLNQRNEQLWVGPPLLPFFPAYLMNGDRKKLDKKMPLQIRVTWSFPVAFKERVVSPPVVIIKTADGRSHLGKIENEEKTQDKMYEAIYVFPVKVVDAPLFELQATTLKIEEGGEKIIPSLMFELKEEMTYEMMHPL